MKFILELVICSVTELLWYSLFRILKVILEFQGPSSLHTHKNSFSNDVRCNAWTGSIKHRAVVFLHNAKAQGKLPNQIMSLPSL